MSSNRQKIKIHSPLIPPPSNSVLLRRTTSDKKREDGGRVRIMVFGTFDIVHKGHENFFRQARKLVKKPYLIVSIARDANVRKIKGKKPLHSENERIKMVGENKLVDKAVLGGITSHIPHIVKEKPSIIALGYDQSYYVIGLEEALAKKGLKVNVVRLKSFKPHIYKTSKLVQNVKKK